MNTCHSTLLVIALSLPPSALARPQSGAAAIPEAASSQEAGGRIDGVLLDAVTQSGLAGASVMLDGDGPSVTCDAQGRFSFEHVRAGAHALIASATSYEPLVRPDVVVSPGRTTAVRLALKASAYRASEKVEVASYFEEAKLTAPGSLSLGQEELRRAPGSGGDVSRALYAVPSVVQVDSSANDLVVRGGSPFENGFYVDNIPFPNINHFPQAGASGGNIGILNVNFVEDLRLLVGGFGARYGSRLSSIVDIRYREGDRRHRQVLLDLNAAGFGADAEGPLGKRGSFMVSAKRSYLDLIANFLGWSGTPRFGDLQGKLVLDLSTRHTLELLSITGDSSTERDAQEAIDSGQGEGHEHHIVGASGVNWRAFWSPRAFSETSVSYGFVNSEQSWRDPVITSDSEKTDYHDGAVSVRSLTTLQPRAGFRLELGGDVAFRDGHGWDDRAKRDVKVSGTELGGFLSAGGDLSSWLALEAGLRLERQPYAGRAHLLPRASLSLRLAKPLSLDLAAGRYAQRLPFFLTKQDPANEALRDPVSTHWVGGLRWQPEPHTRITVDLYAKRYEHFPLSPAVPWRLVIDDVAGDQDSFGYYGPLVDSGRGRAEGVELLLQRRMAGGFHALVGAAYARSRYDDLLGVERNRTFDNRLVLNATLGWRPSREWEAGLRFVFAGGRAVVPIDEQASAAAGETIGDVSRAMEEHLPSCYTLDLRVDRRFYFRGSSLSTYLSIWNATNHGNVRSQFWSPASGRVESEYQWKILPVVGIQYAF